jgi:uncharacterized membrane protein YraQ (UPF0718 family)
VSPTDLGVSDQQADQSGRARRAWMLVSTAGLVMVVAYALNRPLWDWVVHDRLGLEAGTRLGDGVHFFLYDTVKIALLLSGIIFLVAVLRSFVSVERTRALLGGRGQVVGSCWLQRWVSPPRSAPAARCRCSSDSWRQGSPSA